MGIHEDAIAAFQNVYNIRIDELSAALQQSTDALSTKEIELAQKVAELVSAKKNLEIADAELAELRADHASLIAEVEKLRKRIEELEAEADPAVLPFWGAPVWRDEFDGDLSKWNVRHNALTFDQARNMRENVTIENGNLVIRAKWLATPERGDNLPQKIVTHTSGYIDTIGKFSQRYGRWEVRAKMPAGANTRGALSAFWLRNDSHNGEIDIIERWGQGGTMPRYYDPYVKDTGWTTFHSNTNGSSKADYVKTFLRHYQHGIPKDAEDTWHTYAFEYMPDYIAMYVDGKLLKRITPTDPDPENPSTRKRSNGEVINPSGTYAWLWDSRFFGSPFNIRLNLHVGPNAENWGVPDPENRSLTQDPLVYQVDYVRVYKMPGA